MTHPTDPRALVEKTARDFWRRPGQPQITGEERAVAFVLEVLTASTEYLKQPETHPHEFRCPVCFDDPSNLLSVIEQQKALEQAYQRALKLHNEHWMHWSDHDIAESNTNLSWFRAALTKANEPALEQTQGEAHQEARNQKIDGLDLAYSCAASEGASRGVNSVDSIAILEAYRNARSFGAEIVLIDSHQYEVPAPVAAELLRLHLENRGAIQERDAIYDLMEKKRKYMEELRGALAYHMEQTRPIQRSIDALATHPQATEPHAQASEIARLMARAKMDSSLHEMSLATIQTLQDVSAEYNAWIRFHSAGGDYDDFLKQYGAFNE